MESCGTGESPQGSIHQLSVERAGPCGTGESPQGSIHQLSVERAGPTAWCLAEQESHHRAPCGDSPVPQDCMLYSPTVGRESRTNSMESCGTGESPQGSIHQLSVERVGPTACSLVEQESHHRVVFTRCQQRVGPTAWSLVEQESHHRAVFTNCQ